MLVLFLAASAAPTPLYRVYQARWGFSASTLTAVFAVYVLFAALRLDACRSMTSEWSMPYT